MLLNSGNSLDKSSMRQKPANSEWLSEKMWNNITALSLHTFGGDKEQFFKSLPEMIGTQAEVWKKWAYEKMDPENSPIPEYEERIL